MPSATGSVRCFAVHVSLNARCTWNVYYTTASLHFQVKIPIVSDHVSPGTNKSVLTRAPVDSVAAPGFSGEGDTCRTVIVRTEGPVPAKVSVAPNAHCADDWMAVHQQLQTLSRAMAYHHQATTHAKQLHSVAA